MSTIIEQARILWQVSRFVTAAFLVISIWFIGVAMTTVMVEPTRSFIVFGSSKSTLQALTAVPSRLIDGGNGYMIVRGERDGFVRELYAAGAWLVLPVMTGGCRGRLIR